MLLVRKGVEWRAAFLTAAILWGGLVTFFIEFLGYFNLLTAGGLALCWGVAAATPLLLNFRLKKPWQVRGKYSFSPVESGLAGGIALICLATFVTAVLAPPNTWDSMTYHMSRVMHWLQNRSVDHYPTHILRQLEMNPWAEFAIAHFQALSGGDRFANLVQWFSMAGSLVGVSLIAKHLGGDRRAQLFAAVVAATIPMGILQSSSTQNDYVVAFWLISFVWAGLQFMSSKELKWAVLFGASLGLAVLSKGTAYLYAFPFVVWIAIAIFRGAPRQAGLAFLCIVIPFVLLNVNHYHRNLKVFGNPLSSGETKYFNESMSAGTLVSNFLRNTSLQFLSPLDDLNQFIKTGTVQLHKQLNIDIDNPETTWPGTRFIDNKVYNKEDSIGNYLHGALTIVVLLMLLSLKIYRKESVLIRYVSAVVAGYLLFCLILKWQPWHSRLLLPLFVLGAPVIGMIVVKSWKPGLLNIVSLVLLTAALPSTFSNASRPLLHKSSEEGIIFPLLTYERNMFYFMHKWEIYERYVQVANDIQQSKATNIGLILSGDGWEYPLWVLIKEGNPTPVRIEHVEVDNASRFIRTADFVPDYSVRID